MKKYVQLGATAILVAATMISSVRVYSAEQEKKSIEMTLVEMKGEYPEIYNHMGSITYAQFQEAVEMGEKFYIYVGRPTCGDCNDFEPELINLITKYNLGNKILYLNVAELRKDEPGWELFKETYDLQYTPTLAEFSKGRLVTKVEWTPEEGIDIKDVEDYILKNICE